MTLIHNWLIQELPVASSRVCNLWCVMTLFTFCNVHQTSDIFQTRAEVSASFLPACALARSFTRQNFRCQPSRAQGTYQTLPMQQIPFCHDGIMESEDKWKQQKLKTSRFLFDLTVSETSMHPNYKISPNSNSLNWLRTLAGDFLILSHHSESNPSWKSVALEFASSSFWPQFRSFPLQKFPSLPVTRPFS